MIIEMLAGSNFVDQLELLVVGWNGKVRNAIELFK